jgi:hypothetical protein
MEGRKERETEESKERETEVQREKQKERKADIMELQMKVKKDRRKGRKDEGRQTKWIRDGRNEGHNERNERYNRRKA